MSTPAKAGRKALPYDESLVSHGFHMRRHRRRLLQACTMITGEPQRVFFERLLEQEAKRLRKEFPVDATVAKLARAEQKQHIVRESV